MSSEETPGGNVLVQLALTCVGEIVWSAALWLLWNWFVAPLGVHPITFWWALGLSAMHSLIVLGTYWGETKNYSLSERARRALSKSLTWGFILGIGAIAHYSGGP